MTCTNVRYHCPRTCPGAGVRPRGGPARCGGAAAGCAAALRRCPRGKRLAGRGRGRWEAYRPTASRLFPGRKIHDSGTPWAWPRPPAGATHRKGRSRPQLRAENPLLRVRARHGEPEQEVKANAATEPPQPRVTERESGGAGPVVELQAQGEPCPAFQPGGAAGHPSHEELPLVHATRRGSKYSCVPSAQSGTSTGTASSTLNSGTMFDTSRGTSVAMSTPCGSNSARYL